MRYISHYVSPLGNILLTADEIGLTGLWFEGQRHFPPYLDGKYAEKKAPVFARAKRWLDIYFSARKPDFSVPLHFVGTDFQNEVWEILRLVPYGSTTTYGQIAKSLAEKRRLPRMSAQAVGGAVARNGISVIVPCHRVVGANGSLTGYSGGIERKAALLKLEGAMKDEFCVPRHGTAL